MNPGATADRVFEALRRQILENRFHPGDRLDPSAIAKDLVASVTPVRDALNRLTGEGLVDTRSGAGFRIPILDEPRLQDLYQWCEQLLILSIANWPRPRPTIAPVAMDGTLADRTGQLCEAIATVSTNGEHGSAIFRLNGSLHAARMAEPQVIDASQDELAQWYRAIDQDDRRQLKTAISRYHRRRRRVAASIVRAVHRNI